MRKPYKIIVVGTGGVGQAVIKEILRLPEFELTGVLVFRKKKEGRDVGELIGQQPIGLKVTTDQEAVMNLDADCVVWCGYFPMPHIEDAMDKFIIQALESGKNVVTPSAFHYAHLHGEEYVKKFEDACQKGKTCLHGTGENPGFWFERVALTLTGVCNDVEYIGIDEYCNLALTTGSEKMWQAAGFGISIDEANKLTAMRETWEKYFFVETLNLLSMSLWGKLLDKFEFNTDYYVCEEAFELSEAKGDPFDMKFPKGTVAALAHKFEGYIDGELKLYAATNNFLCPDHHPFEGKVDSTWDIEIEGKPTSLKSTIAAQASFKDNLIFYPGDDTSPLYYASVAPILQSIPIVCSREPGIVYPSMFASCAPDLRMLETRQSVVG